jgi:hypothetical protein
MDVVRITMEFFYRRGGRGFQMGSLSPMERRYHIQEKKKKKEERNLF